MLERKWMDINVCYFFVMIYLYPSAYKVPGLDFSGNTL